MAVGGWLKKAVQRKRSVEQRILSNSLIKKIPTTSGWLPTPKLIKPTKLFSPLTTLLSILMVSSKITKPELTFLSLWFDLLVSINSFILNYFFINLLNRHLIIFDYHLSKFIKLKVISIDLFMKDLFMED
jgi:hypothetical protein